MTKAAPVVYLLHGEDEFAIAQFLADLEAKLGDAATAAMNITRLDGRSYNPADLPSVVGAMPFLARRRLVVLSHPLSRLTTPAAREKFKDTLNHLPPTTALVLVEYRTLTEEKDRRKKPHWLERWAEENAQRALVKAFPLPKGGAMVARIQEMARAAGGQITPQAAGLLSSLVGDDPRLANQELQKLLAYTNYRRSIEVDDVNLLTADSGQGDIFAMVDALASRDSRRSLGMLHRLQEQQDAFSIFGMIVRQFRLLLLARDALDRGVHSSELAGELRVHPFVAEKMGAQARSFSLPVLEAVYHRLLDLDEAMKTGVMPADLAMDTFVAAFTSRLD